MEKVSEEARQKRNAYYREWRKKNHDKVVAAQDRYWKKKMVCIDALDNKYALRTVILCKDCKYYTEEDFAGPYDGTCKAMSVCVTKTGYCAYGELPD